MYARSSTITGRPEAVDECIAFIRDEAQPAITVMDRCLGLSMVVDRSSGRCIATSAWQTVESMLNAGEAVTQYRARAGEILGGEPEVDQWEVALMHRAHPTPAEACCRITWSRPPDVSIVLERFRSNFLPRIETFDGFCSASLFVDRLDRRLCGTVTFESRATLDASREVATGLRERAARDYGVEFLEVAEFELAVAHLRVPELV
jgi:hypothetical protein